jgi:hypothetical protein
MAKRNSTENAELIEMVMGVIREQRRGWMKVRRAQFENSARRDAVIERFESRLARKLLSGAGADLADIERRQAQDLARLREDMAAQQKELLAEGERVRERRLAQIRHIRNAGRRFENQRGNPEELICLWFADYIAAENDPATAGRVSFQVMPNSGAGENSAKVSFSVHGRDQQVVWIYFAFVWSVDRDGRLDATSWMYPNGLYSITVPGGCLPGLSTAFVMVGAQLLLFQQEPGATLFPGAPGLAFLGASDAPAFYDDAVNDGSFSIGFTGHVSFPSPNAFSDFITLRKPDGVPVIGGQKLVALVQVTVEASSRGDGEASMDFSSGNMEINVPSVWMTLQF